MSGPAVEAGIIIEPNERIPVKRNLIVLLVSLLTGVAHAQPKVEQAWARPTAQGQAAGGGYLRIDNRTGAADRLLGASASGVASAVELHSMSMDGDVMRMRKVDAIDVPAGGTVELKPGGLHLMLIGLSAPLKAHTMVPLVLRFEKAGELRVQMHVGPGTTDQPQTHDHPK